MSEIIKPVITKEQARVIQFLKSGGNDWTDSDILEYHATSQWSNEYTPLNSLHTIILAAALINGYEVEKTPEEKVREYYESYGGSPSAMERKEAVQDTLDLLGIKIEGVNA
ncbi:hypothetical protein MOC74_21910 [Bacillus haynesii]|uniref:hypothetical protein n=1 Tax=Bacillus haynesii TaxID=1925021 RepID=UPI00227EF46E|nr:hypothetical protein [Bacillus haynesii]MCY8348063.1 hypothetical protein [Bacillus haynesii]